MDDDDNRAGAAVRSLRTRHRISSTPLWKKVGVGFLAAALVTTTIPLSACSQASTNASSSVTQSASQSSSDASSNAQQQGGTPPEQPSSSQDSSAGQSGSTPPEKPAGDSSGSSTGDSSAGQQPSGGAGGGANTQSFDYSGSYTAAVSADGKKKASNDDSVSAMQSDQNALLAQNGGTLTVKNATVEKSGDDSNNADNCNFYGVNSAVLAVGSKSKVRISKSSITSTGSGSNGIFATNGATVYANDDRVTTTSTDGNARGLDATYGGTIIGNRLTISTQGSHSAAVATDRGGGSISLTNSSLSTSGSGSPLLYSTGDIEVENVSGTASGSQIAGMEGLNSILISNSALTSTNDAISGSDPIENGVIIYQSTSGDADTSTGKAANFSVENSALSSSITSGSMFYLTNTTANVVLKNTKLDFDSSKAALLTVQGNDSNNWGSAGSNGATCNFTFDGESVSGAITADDISMANVYLLNGTNWVGSASVTENSASNKQTSKAPLTINVDDSSTWVVGSDSTVTNLNVAKGGKVVDADGKTVTIKAGGKTVVQGTSSVTVTVTGTYSTKVKTGSVNKIAKASISRTSFDKYYGTTTTFGKNDSDEEHGTTVQANTKAENATISTSSSGSSDADGFLAGILETIRQFFFGNS